MGKDSLIKSTTKKGKPKKEKISKKAGSQSAGSAKASKPAGPAKAKAAKSAAKKTEPKPAPTIEELLLKKFADYSAATQSPPALPDVSNMTAPPWIDGNDPAAVERLDALLARKFSMEEIIAVAQPPEELPATEPKPAPTLEELLFKKFSDHPVSKQSSEPLPDLSKMTAPPWIASNDPAEIERLDALLARRFSVEEIIAVAQPPEEPPARVEAAAIPEPPMAEPAPEVSEPAPAMVEAPPPAEPMATAPEPEAQVNLEAPQAAVEEPKPLPPEPVPPAVEPAPATAPVAEEPKPAPPQPTVEVVPPKTVPKEMAQEFKSAPVAAPAQIPVMAESERPAAVSGPWEETSKPPTDPVLRSAKIAVTVVAALVIMIVWASISNHAKYFVTVKKGAMEIWRGEFSPTGRQFFAILHGVQPDDSKREVYSREEIFPIIFNYYLEKSDALLEVSELPDYKSIIEYLEKAERFALNSEMRDAITVRLNNIQRLTLLYKADVDASKDTVESLSAAAAGLEQALRLTRDPVQADTIKKKIEVLLNRRSDLQAAEANRSTTNQEPAPAK
ncbi:MAG: hypothetical protein M0036_25150 [Desulfobacteraceae bacterium]|nr:hypothetical protein [Desulfobacteraceae bacterium]